MEREAVALVWPDTATRGRADAPVARCAPSVKPDGLADASQLAELEQASELLTELLDPYLGPLDGCEWHAVAAARQVIWRLVREARRAGV